MPKNLPLPFILSRPDNLNFSFEFFPPKSEKMEKSLWETIQKLRPLNPSFVSVTYGAGGTTRERTHSTVMRIKEETGLTPASHLTCVNAPKEEIDQIARDYWDAGVRHLVALRGDSPKDAQGNHTDYVPHPDGYAHSTDLIAGLKKIADFEITVSAYPEKHPESKSIDFDLDILKRKIDAGATRAITQYFFDTDVYFRFVERARKAGIEIPIVPGILPVTNFPQLLSFSKGCGTSIPSWMHRLFENLDNRPMTTKLVAITIAVEQCRRLYVGGARDFHFYTLNRAELTYTLCHMLGARPGIEKE
ncbi:MAG: methylenetetrahydrofolate reductase [NAD(P)H] [Alphaproteobacteria bacterium]